MKILKIVINQFRRQAIKLPIGAEILSVLRDRTQIVLYYSGDDSIGVHKVFRHIWTLTTNESLPEGNLKHISTIEVNYGALILHFYEQVDKLWNFTTRIYE